MLTEAKEDGGHGLVPGHVDQPPAQTKVGEDQQHLLHDVVDAGDVLERDGKLRSGGGNGHKLNPLVQMLASSSLAVASLAAPASIGGGEESERVPECQHSPQKQHGVYRWAKTRYQVSTFPA